MSNDTNKRSLLKTVTWRLTGSGATMLIAFLVTGNMSFASSIGAIQLVVNTLLYYIHERMWNMIRWGKQDGV